jgi:hypothetical protein
MNGFKIWLPQDGAGETRFVADKEAREGRNGFSHARTRHSRDDVRMTLLARIRHRQGPVRASPGLSIGCLASTIVRPLHYIAKHVVNYYKRSVLLVTWRAAQIVFGVRCQYRALLSPPQGLLAASLTNLCSKCTTRTLSTFLSPTMLHATYL